MPARYDVEQIIREYWRGANSERAALVKEFRQAVIHGGPEFKLFLAEVAEECHKNKLQPVNALACAMMYGMTVGVLCERERALRENRKIV